ncbi:MAG: Cache 3/Cache 2 fusion domain-containing protein, partial [Lentisphaerota bacterium]
MRLNLKTKVIALAVFAALLPVLVMLALTFSQKGTVMKEVSDELNTLAQMNVAQIVEDVFSMCETSVELMKGRLDQGLQAINVILARGGGVSLGQETIAWSLKYPDGMVTNLTLPVLMFDQQAISRSDNFSERVALVDEIKDLAGLICSVFQRVNERGDMVRVASTVVTPEGKRAVGTVLPAVRADGKDDPVLAAVLSGQIYRGLNPTLGDMYLTAYEPLRDASGKIIGMLGIGWKMDAGNSLVKA